MPVRPCGYAPIGSGQGQGLAPNLPVPELLDLVPRPELPPFAGPEGLTSFPLSSFAVMTWAALLARASYASAVSGLFQRAAAAVVGLSPPVTFTANGPGLVPGFGTISLPGCNVVVVSGTTNFSQWVVQLMNQALVPTGFGPAAPPDAVSTTAFLATAANTISLAFPSHLTKPTFYIGHSLGGAVAQLLWHKARRAGMSDGKCLTFGSPKVANAFLSAQLPRAAGYNKRLHRDGDFVPQLPPDLGALQLLVPPVLNAVSENWGRYQHSGQPYLLGSLGTLSAGEPRNLALAIGGLLFALATNQVIDPSGVHLMPGHFQSLRAGFNEWSGPDVRGWARPQDLDDVARACAAAGV